MCVYTAAVSFEIALRAFPVNVKMALYTAFLVIVDHLKGFNVTVLAFTRPCTGCVDYLAGCDLLTRS